MRNGEESAAWEGEGQKEDDEEQRELKNDLCHVSEDCEEWTEEGVKSELVEHLDPNKAPINSQ